MIQIDYGIVLEMENHGTTKHQVRMKTPPHPDPLPRWGEGRKKVVIWRGAERRGNLVFLIYQHLSFPNVLVGNP